MTQASFPLKDGISKIPRIQKPRRNPTQGTQVCETINARMPNQIAEDQGKNQKAKQ